jgi:hypothetical protein
VTLLVALEYVVYRDDEGNWRALDAGQILRTDEPDEARIVEQHPNSFAEPNWAWATEKGDERR